MTQLDLEKAQALEEEYDPELRFRTLVGPAGLLIGAMLFSLSAFHYYTSGFGILDHHWHVGIHLAFVIGLIFLVFSASRKGMTDVSSAWWRPSGVPLYDWALFGLTVFVMLYIPISYETIIFRIGNPNTLDVLAGTATILLVLEATRRTMGIALPIISIFFIFYGLFGRLFPGPLLHPGTTWTALVDHLYMTNQGIFGIPVFVVATYVFHFVLFGILAMRIGLGQLFIDIAYIIAGRQSGGPAKVSVIASAFFGTLSGSSIANTVTTGALTIPAMRRVGYQRHFAAAVESAASTGGQITPPILGAAAFIMMEFLGVPLSDIILASIIPASMHFLGVLTMVHLEAQRLGLRGLPADEIPRLGAVLKARWPAFIPLILLVGFIIYGYTPYKAAFVGITACIVVGFLNPMQRLTIPALVEAFKLGSKYALAVGAAAASVGIIVGVVTLSGTGFRVSYIVTTAAADLARFVTAIEPLGLFTIEQLTLFLSLVFIALACIVMGAGLPTTATYIVLVAIAAPALITLGVPPLAAHFFVLFYGVLADITPPVAVAAYAGAGIAGANPFRTGNTAFKLGLGKALVPFVFVYSPSMLLVIEASFSWQELVISTATCALGIMLLGSAVIGYLLRPMSVWERLLAAVGAFLLIAPNIETALVGGAIGAAVIGIQLARGRVPRTPAPAVDEGPSPPGDVDAAVLPVREAR